jgi:16S rRNA (cytidine1402-2'-O)-methyltransferase
MPGTLFIVATPIGNLEDITLRALRVLREVAVIAAEDTRRTAGLLAHYDIRTPTLSFHEHNERDRTAALLGRLAAGESVAIVTDAGTPLVSDPGELLVNAARDGGIRVEAVPGPSAILAALVSSGIPARTFTFLGFPPSRGRGRQAFMRALSAEPHTAVFFEAPHRILSTLEHIAELLPGRRLAVGRELTKVHEQLLTGTASEVLRALVDPRGEFTVVVAPADQIEERQLRADKETLWREFCELTGRQRLSRREAVATLARRHGLPTREVYQALEQVKAARATAEVPREPD